MPERSSWRSVVQTDLLTNSLALSFDAAAAPGGGGARDTLGGAEPSGFRLALKGQPLLRQKCWQNPSSLCRALPHSGSQTQAATTSESLINRLLY